VKQIFQCGSDTTGTGGVGGTGGLVGVAAGYHRPMSDTSPTEPSSAAHAAEPSSESDATGWAAEPSAGAHAKDSSPGPRASTLSRWATLAALIIAVLAASVAVAGWFYPNKSASSTPTYTDQQTKDAKKHICETFMVVDRAVVRNSRLKNPPDGGPIGALSVATAARAAFYDGGAYLRDRVNQEPATPPDLAKSVNEMASTLEELAIGYLAGAKDFTQDEIRQSLDDKIKATVEICKKN
jgi:hypothetical protein